jgi:hypothetical protein
LHAATGGKSYYLSNSKRTLEIRGVGSCQGFAAEALEVIVELLIMLCSRERVFDVSVAKSEYDRQVNRGVYYLGRLVGGPE